MINREIVFQERARRGSASGPQAADASTSSSYLHWSDQLLTQLISLQFQYDIEGSSGFCDDLQSSSGNATDLLERMLNQELVAAHYQFLKTLQDMKRALANGEHEAYEALGKVAPRLMAENRKTTEILLDRADRAKSAGQPKAT